MVDEKTTTPEETAAETPEEGTPQPEEIEEPMSKYERIMMAAAEATRLNEEVRRKGTKLQHKIPIEALKRVDEGKVKAVINGKESGPRPRVPLPPPEKGDPLFMNPPLLGEKDSPPAPEKSDAKD